MITITHPPKSTLILCDDLANRLRAYKGRQQQARARGLVEVETPMAEFFEAGAEAALEAFGPVRATLPTPLRVACEAVAKRLRLFQRTAEQARERTNRGEEVVVELPVAELFEPADALALDAYETELAALLGQVPLPMEGAS